MITLALTLSPVSTAIGFLLGVFVVGALWAKSADDDAQSSHDREGDAYRRGLERGRAGFDN